MSQVSIAELRQRYNGALVTFYDVLLEILSSWVQEMGSVATPQILIIALIDIGAANSAEKVAALGYDTLDSDTDSDFEDEIIEVYSMNGFLSKICLVALLLIMTVSVIAIIAFHVFEPPEQVQPPTVFAVQITGSSSGLSDLRIACDNNGSGILMVGSRHHLYNVEFHSCIHSVLLDGNTNTMESVVAKNADLGITVSGQRNMISNIRMHNMAITGIDVRGDGNHVYFTHFRNVRLGVEINGDRNVVKEITYDKDDKDGSGFSAIFISTGIQNSVTNVTCTGLNADRRDIGFLVNSRSSEGIFEKIYCGSVWINGSRNTARKIKTNGYLLISGFQNTLDDGYSYYSPCSKKPPPDVLVHNVDEFLEEIQWCGGRCKYPTGITLSEGEYILNSTIVLHNSKCSIRGQGPGLTIIRFVK